MGIFCCEAIKKHMIVAEYVGEVVSMEIADLREKNINFGCYMFSLDRYELERCSVIDATFSGNMARYLNHSCNVTLM